MLAVDISKQNYSVLLHTDSVGFFGDGDPFISLRAACASRGRFEGDIGLVARNLFVGGRFIAGGGEDARGFGGGKEGGDAALVAGGVFVV